MEIYIASFSGGGGEKVPSLEMPVNEEWNSCGYWYARKCDKWKHAYITGRPCMRGLIRFVACYSAIQGLPTALQGQ